MFKFGFNNIENEDSADIATNKVTWSKCIEINPMLDDDILKEVLSQNKPIEVKLHSTDIRIKILTPNDVLNVLKSSEIWQNCALNDAETQHSDLVASVYEGGCKIWECTYDLLNYLDIEESNQFSDKNVLDLGCGSGLLGIYTLLKGCQSCTMQDYNSEVIKYITIPNVSLNCEAFLQASKFYSGDWAYFAEMLGDKFDYILTSETIYNTENYSKLHKVFEKCLKPSGRIYLAAKSYYFGVGGGTELFKEFIVKQDVFKYEACWSSTEGVKREVIKLCFK